MVCLVLKILTLKQAKNNFFTKLAIGRIMPRTTFWSGLGIQISTAIDHIFYFTWAMRYSW